MAFFGFGEFDPEVGYKVLDERIVRGNAGVMLLVGIVAFVNGFVIRNFSVLPWLSGFLAFNFAVAVLINPKFAPTMIVSKWMVGDQVPLPIGAIQKRFAWTLGLALSLAIFGLSFLLIGDPTWFNAVCMLCLICLTLLYMETAFGVCVGCKLYFTAIDIGLMKKPEITPACMGGACEVDLGANTGDGDTGK